MTGIFAAAEAHEDGLGAEDAFEAGDHRDAAAAAGRDGALAEGLLVGLLGCLVGGHVDGRHVSLTAMTRSNLHLYALGGNLLEMLLE